jgi:hypothetical protein
MLDGRREQTMCASPSFWLDASKALLGSFAGAGFAFAFATYQRHRHERRANQIAGNLALFKLYSIQKQIHLLRYLIRRDIASRFSTVPFWNLLTPILVTIDDNLSFDFESLAFLLTSESGRLAIMHLKRIEEIFNEGREILKAQIEVSHEVRKAIDPLLQNGPVMIAHDQANKHVGQELITRSSSLTKALVIRTEKLVIFNDRTFTALDKALRTCFRSREVWKLDITPQTSHSDSQIPPLPKELQSLVDQATKVDL